MTEQTKWIAEEEAKSERIDKYVCAQLEDATRSNVQNWLQNGDITVNEMIVRANYKVKVGDVITFTLPEVKEAEIEPENIPLDVVYEDDDVVVVNKPRGLVVHPGNGNTSGTLVNALMYHTKNLSGINGIIRPGIVHRIDKDTSGLLVVAKNDKAHVHLSEQLKAKSASRKYVAIVHGVIPHALGTIDAPIGRDTSNRQNFTVTGDNSKDAITHFKVLERFANHTLVECELETGRTHQIRVHMKYIGFPLAGDPKYGPKRTLPLQGQALHARELSFIHPRTGETMTFTAPLPNQLSELIEELKKGVIH
ncbi:MAG: RluA family pseudouridine synthase [Bacilli bacterium]